MEVKEKLTLLWLFVQVKIDNSFAQVITALINCQLEIILNFGNKLASAFCFALFQVNCLLVMGVIMRIVA